MSSNSSDDSSLARTEKSAKAPQLENSIPFRIELTLSSDFDGLVALLSGAALRLPGFASRASSAEQVVRSFRCLLANLFTASNFNLNCFMAIPLGRSHYPTKSRYNSERIGYDNLLRVLSWLRQENLIDVHPGFRNPTTGFGRNTRIAISSNFRRLLSRYRRHGLNAFELAQFGAKPSDKFECIRLKAAKVGRGRPALIQYKETKDISEMRSRLREWNRFLDTQWADLWATDEEFESLPRSPNLDYGDTVETHRRTHGVDLSRRHLYRVFNNGTFKEGGRFYGGWWQEIPSSWRKNITINGFACRELDYSNFQPMMLYADAGKSLESYAYSIDGIADTPKNKDAIKTTFFKLLYANKGQRIAPIKAEHLPEGWSWKELLDAVKERHAPIAEYFQSGIALKMQRKDSDIAESVMIEMMRRGILVLPIHDSFLVRSGYFYALKDAMMLAYRKAMGTDIKITVDLSYRDLAPDKEIASTQEVFRKILDKEQQQKTSKYKSYFGRLERALKSESISKQSFLG